MTILAIILLLVVVSAGILAIYLASQRRRSPSAKDSGGSSDRKRDDEPPEPAKKPAPAHGGHGGGHGKSLFLSSLKFLVVGFLAICLGWIVVTGHVGVILTHIGDEILHVLFDPAQAPQGHASSQTSFAAVPQGTNALPDADACKPFAKSVVHTCTITEATTIMQGPDVPAGLRFCWTPGVDTSDTPKKDRTYAKVEQVLQSGDVTDFDPDHPIDAPVVGYIFTPAKKRLVMSYWMTDTTCTAPVGNDPDLS